MIVRKMNRWPRSEASRSTMKFWGQSFSRGHYQSDILASRKGPGFVYLSYSSPLNFEMRSVYCWIIQNSEWRSKNDCVKQIQGVLCVNVTTFARIFCRLSLTMLWLNLQKIDHPLAFFQLITKDPSLNFLECVYVNQWNPLRSCLFE